MGNDFIVQSTKIVLLSEENSVPNKCTLRSILSKISFLKKQTSFVQVIHTHRDD